jgi:thiol:disulfide interchange protein DsbD
MDIEKACRIKWSKRMNRKLLKKGTGLCLLALGLLSCSSGDSGSSIPWQPYDPAVLYRARQEGKPVLLEFYADWCVPCVQLEEHTFSNEGVVNSTWSFVRVRVDMSDYESAESERLREEFGVTGVPEMLFLDARGNELKDERIIGFVGPEDFLRRIERALKPGPRKSPPV